MEEYQQRGTLQVFVDCLPSTMLLEGRSCSWLAHSSKHCFMGIMHWALLHLHDSFSECEGLHQVHSQLRSMSESSMSTVTAQILHE